MARKADEIDRLLHRVMEGIDTEAAAQRLAALGAAAVDPILDALEGNHGRRAPERDPRDFADDLLPVLIRIAEHNPEPLLEALPRRPQSVVSLVWALRSSRDPRAVDALIDALGHKNQFVRWSAAEALTRVRNKRVIEPLLKALRDRSSLVRFTVADALNHKAYLRDARAVEPLKKLLASKNFKERDLGTWLVAQEALAKLEEKYGKERAASPARSKERRNQRTKPPTAAL
jgi:HEAT repeat protein